MSTTPDFSPFVLSLVFVMAREGGFADDRDDPGGTTNYGIIQKNYKVRSVVDITMREVCDIYWRDYWLTVRCDQVAISRPRLALAHFDCAVNQGQGQAPYCLQRAVSVTADGDIGPVTLAAVAQCDEDRAITALLEDRARVYRMTATNRPASRKFLAGWLSRLRWVARATDTPITPAFAGSK